MCGWYDGCFVLPDAVEQWPWSKTRSMWRVPLSSTVHDLLEEEYINVLIRRCLLCPVGTAACRHEITKRSMLFVMSSSHLSYRLPSCRMVSAAASLHS